MKIILLVVKVLISTMCAYYAFIKIKSFVENKSSNDAIALLWKDKVKKLQEHSIFDIGIINTLKLNCDKLGINVFGIEIIVLLVGIIVSIVLFNVFKVIFKIKSVAVILSVPFVFCGFIIIQYYADKKQDKLEEVMNDFFIQFRGEVKINNDIIAAFKKIQNTCLPPFNEYINKMIFEIGAGEIPEESLKRFADKVDIDKFNLYVNNLKYCNIYGGNVEILTLETQKMIEDLLKQKKKRKKETRSICMSLYMLIALDLLIYFNLIANNLSYINLMRNSFAGNMILNINFISIWLIVWLASYVQKMDM